MKTSAYISSNPEVQAQLNSEIERCQAAIKDAEGRVRELRASTPEAKSLKKDITRNKEQVDFLRTQLPEMLFSEANALDDLEQEMAGAIAEWDAAKARWLVEAGTNPAYAVEYAASIVGKQAAIEHIFRLQRHWPALAESEGRSLATFRKAYAEIAEIRQRDMMSKLTGGHSSCAFHNAVEHEQGRALAKLGEYGDHIQLYLSWYEHDAAKLQPAA